MKKIKKLSLYFIVFVAAIALLTPLAEAASNLGIDGPCYAVLSPTNEVNEMAVTWWDVPEATSGSVQYGTSQDLSGTGSTVPAALTKNDTDNGYSAFEAVMTDLEEGTDYYYRVGKEGAWSSIYSFRTGVSDSNEVSFLYMGDIQYASYVTAVEDYAAWGSLLAGAVGEFPSLDFALLGGDMVQQGQAPGDWQWFYSNATPTFSQLPFLAVPGNHESNAAYSKPELFLKLFKLPDNGPENFKEQFFSYDYGNCHVVGVNTSVFLDTSLTDTDYEALAAWIESDLENSDATWKIVVMHHPAYAVVSDATATQVLANWEPVFVEQQVDLVLCGHQHIYMRTKMMRGVTYVMGNSGSKHYDPAEVPYSEVMIADTSNYEIISMDGGQLTMTAYDAAGEVLDSVALTAKDRSIPPYFPEEHLGDMNGDGFLTQADVTLLLNAILSNAAYSEIADYNQDGKVDIRDAHRLSLDCQ